MDNGFSKQTMLAELNVKYNRMRYELLAVAIFTALNIISVIIGTNSYFLFSASLPYSLVLNASYDTGRFPTYTYAAYETSEFLPEALFWAAVAFAAVIIAVYLLCFFFSKKKPGWMLAAMILFAIDTVVYLIGFFSYLLNETFEVSDLTDLAFHGIILLMLLNGVITANKIKKVKAMPDPEEEKTSPEFADFSVDDNYNDDYIDKK